MFARLIVAKLVIAAAGAFASAEDIRVADQGLFERLDADGDGRLVADELPKEQSRLFARLVRQGDKNRDGELSKLEWQAATTPRRPEKPIEEKRPNELPGADAARLVLLMLDTDEDGVLTREEAPRDLRGVFDRIVEQYDRNDDERINRLELARGGPQLTRMSQQTVRRLDINVDRELKKFDRQQGSAAMRFTEAPSRGEFLRDPQQSLALFEELDKDKDGLLALDETPAEGADRWKRLFRLGDRNRDGLLSRDEFRGATQRAARRMEMMSAE
ncbi:EF-hand domain-containing protein [Aeoliella sp. SH292]|uniref:EF-hand domain-containing protein n=1 Tax=Aeoliella sp. SH292 TaxID=3454464 RepID=UPI003F97B365